MKKFLPVIIIALVILALGAGFLLWRGKSSSQEATLGPEEEGVLIETTLEERPYVTMTPRADGREFTLDISRIKNATKIEYELVYLSQGLSRGVVGSIDLKGKSEVSRDLLLGTCSRDVCKYDEGVEEGTLTLRFRTPEGTMKFASDFHLQQGDDELTSVDGQFQIEGTIPSGAFYITMSTVGLPGEIEGEVVGGPYATFTSGSQAIKKGKVSLTLSREVEETELYSWSGTKWQIEEAEIDGKVFSASIDSLATFVAVAPGGEPSSP